MRLSPLANNFFSFSVGQTSETAAAAGTYITLCYAILHYIKLHCITIHYITLHYITLQLFLYYTTVGQTSKTAAAGTYTLPTLH